MDQNSPFIPLLLIMLLAVAVPFLANRIKAVRIPIVVGEILAGILIGRSGFNLVEPTPILGFLSEFGFAFLMFLSGLEVKFESLFSASDRSETSSRWRHPVFIAVLYFFLTVVLAMLSGFSLTAFNLAKSPILMGLILSTTSLGIVVPTLKERALTTTAYGQAVLVAALISDFATLLLLSFVIAILSQGLSLDLMLFLVLLAAFVVAAKISRLLNRIPGLTRLVTELSHATAQIRVRGAFALMVTCVALADALGVEVILGAFLAGAIVSLSSHGQESPLPEKLDAIGYGFFIPIFFIHVGTQFDVGALRASRSALLLVPILIVTAYLIKLLPAILYRTLFSWRETLALGTLLAARLSLIIAASAIALNLQLISTATNSALILVAVVSCTFSPILFSRILPPVVQVERQGVVIFGTDQLAILLALRLRDSGEEVTFIGNDQKQLKRLQRRGFHSISGEATDERVLEQAGLSKARAIIAVSNSPNLVAVCRLSKEHFEVPTVIARADNPQTVQQLQALEVRVVQPAMAVALALEGALLFPAAFNLLSDRKDNVDLTDVVFDNPAYDGRPLRKIRLPGNALILGIQRRGEVIVPHGDTVLRQGDVLVVVGSSEALKSAQQQLGDHRQ